MFNQQSMLRGTTVSRQIATGVATATADTLAQQQVQDVDPFTQLI